MPAALLERIDRDPNQRIERIVPHIKEYRPRGLARWICIDDRFALTDGELYRQTAGGAVGAGEDWAVAMAMGARRRANSAGRQVGEMARSKYGRAPVQVLGGIATKVLKQEGVLLNLHEGCAAEDSAQPIGGIIASRDDKSRNELFTRSKAIKPDLTADEFLMVVDVWRQDLLAEQDTRQSRILPASIGAVILGEGKVGSAALTHPEAQPDAGWVQDPNTGGWQMSAVDRVALVKASHVSPDLIADHRRYAAFDSKGAWEAGTPAYHISYGDMTRELADPLGDLAPFRIDDFLTATAVRHAATSMALDGYVDQERFGGQMTIQRVL
jgi:hypothetical protein